MPYHHLSAEERHVIYHLRLIKLSFREIGRRLGRHHATIAREVARATPPGPHHVYVGGAGELRYRVAKHRAQHQRRRGHRPLWRYVVAGLERRWSPEQIAGRLKRDHPDDPAMRVSPETIYGWIYDDAERGGTLHLHLRRAHKKRRKQKRLGALRSLIKDRVSIHDRPLEADDRRRFGDWEGDTVMGARRQGAVVTLVDRSSRFLLAGRLGGKSAAETSSRITRLLARMPKAWRRTLTLDNGTEFAQFKTVEKKTGVKVFFADPYTASQRGTNENTNGLLRQYYPKGCNFHDLSDPALEKTVREINNRPRKCLGYRTPSEVRKNQGGALSTGI